VTNLLYTGANCSSLLQRNAVDRKFPGIKS